MTTLQAPLTIYVDEAGTPDFKRVEICKPVKAYVPCAVAVPTCTSQNVLKQLPRSRDGQLLKSSDRAFSEMIALQFLEQLRVSTCEVAAILIDPGGDDSVKTAQGIASLVTKRRQAVHHSKVSATSLSYSLLVAEVIINVIAMVTKRTGDLPTFIDVVLDEVALSRFDRRLLEQALRKAGKSRILFGRFEWASEKTEPMLLVPDLVAGVLHRHGTVGDVPRACKFIVDAAKADRFSLQDGHRLHSSRRRTAISGDAPHQTED